LQRQAARDALSEARASALNASFKLEVQVTTLRKENAALKTLRNYRGSGRRRYGVTVLINHTLTFYQSDEELNLQEEYDALNITHRELKHVG
jgi:hypothetical protein